MAKDLHKGMVLGSRNLWTIRQQMAKVTFLFPLPPQEGRGCPGPLAPGETHICKAADRSWTDRAPMQV